VGFSAWAIVDPQYVESRRGSRIGELALTTGVGHLYLIQDGGATEPFPLSPLPKLTHLSNLNSNLTVLRFVWWHRSGRVVRYDCVYMPALHSAR